MSLAVLHGQGCELLARGPPHAEHRGETDPKARGLGFRV